MPPRPKAPASTEATLESLAAKFDVEDHKKNPKGYTYVAIEKVINRLNTVLGANWDLTIEKVQFSPVPGLTWSRAGKPAAFATVVVKIEALLEGRLVARMGVGGDFGAVEDADKLVKTALAEAIKKAGNQFGIALYLWEEEERALIDAAAAAGMTGQVVAAPPPGAEAHVAAIVEAHAPTDAATLDDLKNKVADIAVLAGVQRTGPAIAAHFNIPVESLQDEATLRAIITANLAA